MADERTYGFNKDDAEALVQSISNGEDWFPEIKPRGGGRSVVTSVRFEIVSSDPTTLTGLATLLAWNYGFTQSQIPAAILGNTVIEICDPKGCFLNEPNVDLTGRQGTAVYRQGLPGEFCRLGYAPFDGVWEVETLCCKLISCEVII